MSDAERQELQQQALAQPGESPADTWRRRYLEVASVIDSLTQAEQYGDRDAMQHWLLRLRVYAEAVLELEADKQRRRLVALEAVAGAAWAVADDPLGKSEAQMRQDHKRLWDALMALEGVGDGRD